MSKYQPSLEELERRQKQREQTAQLRQAEKERAVRRGAALAAGDGGGGSMSNFDAAERYRAAQAETLIRAVTRHYKVDARRLSPPAVARLGAELLASRFGGELVDGAGKLRPTWR